MFFNKNTEKSELRGNLVTMAFIVAICRKIGMTPKELVELSHNERKGEDSFLNGVIKAQLELIEAKKDKDNK